MKDKRNLKLARRLALWAVADQIDHESIDKHVLAFSKTCNPEISKLAIVEEKIENLQNEKDLIVKKMIDSSSESIKDLVSNTENEMAKPLVDLAFWNRMQNMNCDLFDVLHINVDEIGDETEEVK